eukprot:234918-Chlamydomonas_euryale.AAC.1
MPSPPARHSRNGKAFGPGARPPPRPKSLAACATSATLPNRRQDGRLRCVAGGLLGRDRGI